MKNLIITVAFTLAISFNVLAQANRTAMSNQEIKTTTVQGLRVNGTEGHYCDYCKGNYEASHFPCIMKAIKGKVNAMTGAVEFVAGQPIKGVIVKGGKNPGGNLNLMSDTNGEFELNNAEPGNYMLVITLPTHDAQAFVSGSPIGGIVVKGGKNPGGNSLQVVTNVNGQVYLTITEAGNYKFSLSAAKTQGPQNPLYESSQTETVNPLQRVKQ